MRQAVRLLAIVPTTILIAGCAVGMRVNPDGSESPVVGFPVGSWSGEQIGNAVGGILGAIGVPGAGIIGTGVAGLIAALGWGARQKHIGERTGWEEAATTYTAPPPPPPSPPAGGVGRVEPQPAPGT